ncbi:MAG: TlpA family protein disulfide reductase [Bacteroidetes bacterium]|nr:TlpA family protein disulfide reductase [Bacteroidota bacterium]MBS1631080.1 TlpA family protein disulfide reductase [Bacteroidota bacterium]
MIENSDNEYKNQIEAMVEDQHLITSLKSETSVIDSRKEKFIFDSIIKKLNGNIVYVDFWASWCLPCRSEMLPSKRLRIKYSKDSIKFVYMSIDKDISAWRNASAQENINNYQYNYWFSNFDSSILAKKIKLITIPHYILINKESKIVDTDAPRPSDPKLILILDKLLNKKN